ncbi:MAG: chemotaxis protein CheW [Chlamydiales bacterium]|nr:chemotaxis protein CheW [Chlamydiales bacterium]NCF70303.1 chemotaxis protein CheW [Chlamydiales bacterium]
MLMLLFSVGEDRYSLDCSQVVEIIPMVEVKKMVRAPDYISGIFNYRGRSVPVVDLCTLMISRPTSGRLSSRVVLVECKSNPEMKSKIIGILAEKMTETVKVENRELVTPGVNIERLPFLDKLFKIGSEMVQSIDLEKLMDSMDLKNIVFAEGQ